MAYNRANLSIVEFREPLTLANGGPWGYGTRRVYDYVTGDTKSQVNASNYFDDAYELATGDFIRLDASDGKQLLCEIGRAHV